MGGEPSVDLRKKKCTTTAWAAIVHFTLFNQDLVTRGEVAGIIHSLGAIVKDLAKVALECEACGGHIQLIPLQVIRFGIVIPFTGNGKSNTPSGAAESNILQIDIKILFQIQCWQVRAAPTAFYAGVANVVAAMIAPVATETNA